MATPRMQRLKKMAANFPAMDAQAEKREQSALAVQTQGAIKSAPKSSNIKAQAQQIGQAVSGAQGQIAAKGAASGTAAQLQAGATGVGLEQQAAQQELAQKGMQQTEAQSGKDIDAKRTSQQADLESRKTITDAQIQQQAYLQDMGMAQDNRLSAVSLKQRDDLHALGKDLNGKLFDSTMRFEEDEIGRKFSNERQLQDYMVSNAKSDIALKDQMREMQQVADREIYMMEAAYKALEQEEKQKFKSGEQSKGQAHMQKVRHAKEEMARSIRKKKAKRDNRKAILTGVGTVVGAVVGGYFTGGTGAMAGGAAGGKLLGSLA